MNRIRLGNSGLMVSRLCFGTLTIGPVQKNLDLATGAALLCYAYEQGINFFDTAEQYNTYPYLRLALKKHPEMVLSSKSFAVSASEMRLSIELARQSLDRDYIDIFCLHEVENAATFRGHQGALEYLYRAKADGLIRAVGISSHTIAGVRAGATVPGIDIIHPLINRDGIGIKDGSTQEMIAALETAKEFGKGIYAMKVLAGGHLNAEVSAAVQFAVSLPCIDSLAIGMQSGAEIQYNLSVIAGEPISARLQVEVAAVHRRLMVADWCQGCGQCIARCDFGALAMEGGKLRVDELKCLRCGYCARACPEFCLKIV